MRPTICACATAIGGSHALLRLSGPDATAIVMRVGLPSPTAWHLLDASWPLAGGQLPCRMLAAPGARSYTGEDLIEIEVPGSRDVVELALAALRDGGAEAAPPGGFTRQALGNRRLSLDQAEAVLAVTHASDAPSAERALSRLRGDLGRDLAEVRGRILALRALVEAGLDFLDEEDVRAYQPAALQSELAAMRQRLARWRVAAAGIEGVPLICLVGPANAGKSSLFVALSGGTALISTVPGTTRDVLEEEIVLGDRRCRLADTAGWMATAIDEEHAAVAAGRRLIPVASLIIACSAPDAHLPEHHDLPASRTLVVATKADLGPADPRASIAVSVHTGNGLDELRHVIATRLEPCGSGEPRQQRLLSDCDHVLGEVSRRLPGDDLLAEELRRLAQWLGELIGETTPDQVLDLIFARFCIGK